MRWDSPAREKRWEWHQWFAWCPVRIPDDRYVAGQWVWWETVERKRNYTSRGGMWDYREAGVYEVAP